MTALSFVWVHPYSQNSGCDITLKSLYSYNETKSFELLKSAVPWLA